MSSPYRGNNWIDQLPEDVRQLVRDRMSSKLVDKGEVIYREGLLHTALWQIRSGAVRITNQSLDGKEVIFAIFSQGDCFGELSLLDGIAAANTATAVERVELAELAKEDFEELFEEYPAFARQLAHFLSSRMRHMLSFYADVTLHPLEQRIARRICTISSGNLGDAKLQFTQQDLAAMVGATRQAVSKVLNQWRGQGIIDLQYGKISVLQSQQLREIADSLGN
jgi:CRP/FNR family transcriptional regulator, cyclic AMP receptor protein